MKETGDVVTREDARNWSAQIYEGWTSGDPQAVKEAEERTTKFTRTRVRELGVYRKVIPMEQAPDNRLSRAVDTSLPVIVVDREPDSPAAAIMSFNQSADGIYIKADRYRILFARVTTSDFVADIDTLRTYEMDIRQVLSDNSIRDLLAEEDAAFFSNFNSCLVARDVPCATSGIVQWQHLPGGITKNSLWEARKIIGSTSSNLEPHTAIINQVSINDIGKFTFNEMGGTLAGDIMRDGLKVIGDMMGLKWIVSVKKNLIPTDTIYWMADPDYIGYSYYIQDVTMYVKRDGPMIQFRNYETIGGAIGWTSGLARSDFGA